MDKKVLYARLPADLYERLVQRAAEDRRSVNQEAAVLLERALQCPKTADYAQ